MSRMPLLPPGMEDSAATKMPRVEDINRILVMLAKSQGH